jgi:hypothetical protein
MEDLSVASERFEDPAEPFGMKSGGLGEFPQIAAGFGYRHGPSHSRFLETLILIGMACPACLIADVFHARLYIQVIDRNMVLTP